VSPLAVLARGYVLVRDRDGHAVTDASALRTGMRLDLRHAETSTGLLREVQLLGHRNLPVFRPHARCGEFLAASEGENM